MYAGRHPPHAAVRSPRAAAGRQQGGEEPLPTAGLLRRAVLQLGLAERGLDLLEDGEALQHPALELRAHARGGHAVQAVQLVRGFGFGLVNPIANPNPNTNTNTNTNTNPNLRVDVLGPLALPLLDELELLVPG